jgi:hypothetical protein
MVVTETIVISRDQPSVYAAFADIAGWTRILPDVQTVELLYWDGYNQEFRMTVERPGGPETIRGIRYCRPCSSLELFHPVPPPGVKRMAGQWTFKERAGLTTVVATRTFQLCDDELDGLGAEREAAFAEILRQALRTNLSRFKNALERHAEDHATSPALS